MLSVMPSLCLKFIGVNKVCVLNAYQVFKTCYSFTSENNAASRCYLCGTDEEAGAVTESVTDKRGRVALAGRLLLRASSPTPKG